MDTSNQTNKDYLVCIDSDGCAIDSMTIKHVKAFGPAFVEIWHVKGDMEEAVLTEWNRINLYASSRGINRFQGLVAILKVFSYLDDENDIDKLSKWTETTKALSSNALHKAYDESGLSIMYKALTWSNRVNEIIESMPLAEPFEGVKEAIKTIKEDAHIAVVSSANQAAIEAEWKHCGLYDMVDYFYSQKDGTKTECIRKLKDKGYDSRKIIMIGDAFGDYKAAKENEVWFYPILATKEVDSWKKFIELYFKLFTDSRLNKADQLYWINSMKDNLS